MKLEEIKPLVLQVALAIIFFFLAYCMSRMHKKLKEVVISVIIISLIVFVLVGFTVIVVF